MVIVDDAKCIGCGLCVENCHEGCMSLVDGKVRIAYETCSTCTQCVAICPQRALSWDHVAAEAFDDARLPTPEHLDELFKQRRSIRVYRPQKIARPLLEEIVNYGIYAPTHNPAFRAIVVDDAAVIAALDRILLRFVSLIHTLAYKPRFVGTLARWIGMAQEYELARPKLEESLEAGRSFDPPAAIVFIVGDRRVPLSVDSAQYALANIMLYAQVKGMASCLWGNAPIFMDKHRAARRLLGLKRGDRIFGALFLGYPGMRFRNKVQGKTLPIQWNRGA